MPRPPRALPLLAAALLLALPGTAGALASCLPPGCVAAHLAAFAPPATVVRSGQALAWESLDILHTATEDALGAAPRPCFHAVFAGRSGTVTFALDDAGGLRARSAGRDLPCLTAQALPGEGGAVVGYNCRIHPWMVGAVVVLA